MAECRIFRVFSYNPYNPKRLPDMVMSLRKNGLIQIEIHDVNVKEWEPRMMLALKAYQTPDEVFEKAKLEEIRGSSYLLTVRWSKLNSLTR